MRRIGSAQNADHFRIEPIGINGFEFGEVLFQLLDRSIDMDRGNTSAHAIKPIKRHFQHLLAIDQFELVPH